MLTGIELKQLERSYRGVKVLSVYLDDAAHPRAQRPAWRRELDHIVAEVRDGLCDADPGERAAFDRCVRRMEESLDDRCARHARGWTGFFPEEGVSHIEPLPVTLAGPMPSLVAWDEGMRVAPYVCALTQNRPAIVALVNSTAAILHRYAFGRLEEVETLRLHPAEERGAAAALLRELSDRLVSLAGPQGWILLGGDPAQVDDLVALLPVSVEHRVHRLRGMRPDSTHLQILRAAERGCAEARAESELALVSDVLERHAAGGHGIAGFASTLEALQQRAVDRLYFTGTFLSVHPAGVELLVRTALEQDVPSEYVSESAAEKLNVAGGVAASLRYVPIRGWPPVVAPDTITSSPLHSPLGARA